MSKLVKINDRKPIEIYIGRKTRGPITGVRLSEAVIGRILRSIDAPKDVYAIGPNNVTVKLTLDNYMKPEEELFNLIKAAPVVAEEEAKAKAEALRKSLEAKKHAEPEVKHDPVKSENTETVVEEKVIETVTEPEVQDNEKVEDAESIKVDETVETSTDEIVEDDKTTPIEEEKAPVKNYNNYNKNYNKNNKNRK